MRFLIEGDNELIIYKFDLKDDLIKPQKYSVIFYGKYKNIEGLRNEPLSDQSYLISRSQIAQDGQFIYIPSDQIKGNNYLYRWPTAIKSKTISKAA